jgi:hypothetical protein
MFVKCKVQQGAVHERAFHLQVEGPWSAPGELRDGLHERPRIVLISLENSKWLQLVRTAPDAAFPVASCTALSLVRRLTASGAD